MITGSTSAVALAYYALSLVSVAMSVLLATWIYRNHWTQRGAKWFTVVLLAGGAWSLLHLFSLLLAPSTLQSVVVHLRILASHCAIGAFVVFGSVYTDRQFHRRWPVAALLGFAIGGYALLAVTNPWHGLLFEAVTQVTTPVPYPSVTVGLTYASMFVTLAVLVVATTFAMVIHLLSLPRRTGGQIVLLLSGTFAIAAFQYAGMAGLFPAANMTHAVYGVLPFTVLTFLAVFRFRLLDVQPIARNTVVEKFHDPVLVLDENRCVVDFNEASTDIWPGLPDEIGSDFEAVCPALADAIAAEGPLDAGGDETDCRITLPVGGTDRHFSVNASTVARNERGGGAWMSILLRDITELEQSRWQLEKQNERLDQVASTISHDLRNPINVVEGYTDILARLIDEDGLDAEDADRALEYLEKSRASQERMEDIIADILTIAREGKTVDETKPVSLDSLAEEAWDHVDTRDATVTVTEDVMFEADRSKTLTIFENLFRNALDHGPADVEIEVGPTDDGFYVADDGPGIPDEHVGSVFEYGYTTSEDGTGLGLSIVRTMAESHGWTVSHDKSYTDGARFVFDTGGTEPVTSRDSHAVRTE